MRDKNHWLLIVCGFSTAVSAGEGLQPTVHHPIVQSHPIGPQHGTVIGSPVFGPPTPMGYHPIVSHPHHPHQGIGSPQASHPVPLTGHHGSMISDHPRNGHLAPLPGPPPLSSHPPTATHPMPSTSITTPSHLLGIYPGVLQPISSVAGTSNMQSTSPNVAHNSPKPPLHVPIPTPSPSPTPIVFLSDQFQYKYNGADFFGKFPLFGIYTFRSLAGGSSRFQGSGRKPSGQTSRRRTNGSPVRQSLIGAMETPSPRIHDGEPQPVPQSPAIPPPMPHSEMAMRPLPLILRFYTENHHHKPNAPKDEAKKSSAEAKGVMPNALPPPIELHPLHALPPPEKNVFDRNKDAVEALTYDDQEKYLDGVAEGLAQLNSDLDHTFLSQFEITKEGFWLSGNVVYDGKYCQYEMRISLDEPSESLATASRCQEI